MIKLIFLFFLCISFSCVAQNDETREAKKYYQSGAMLFQKQDYIGANRDFSKALQFRTKIKDSYLLCDLYINRALCRMYLGSSDALADANEAVNIKPEYSKSYYVRAMIRLRVIKDADKALLDIDTAIRAKPGETEYLLLKMSCYEKKKMYKEELEVQNKILDFDSKNTVALTSRGTTYNALKDFDSAIKDFKHVLEVLPNDFATLVNLASAYAQQNNWEEAKNYYFLSIKADSTQAFIVYNNLAYFVGQIKNDYKASIEFCNKAIEKNPKFPFSFSNRGFAELKLGDTKAAMKDVQKSIDMDPKNSYAYKNRALILIAENKISSACLDLHKAKELDYSILYDDEVDKLLEKHCR